MGTFSRVRRGDPGSDTVLQDNGRGSLLSLGWDARLDSACEHYGVSLVSVCGRGRLDRMRPLVDVHSQIIEVSSQQDLEEVLGALARHDLLSQPFSRVTSADEFALVTAAGVAAALDVGGLEPVVAATMRNKIVQKRLVSAAGLPVAEFAVIDDIASTSAPPRGWSRWPAVIKPSSGADTAATALLHGTQDFNEFLEWRRGWQPGARLAATWASIGGSEFLLEEYIDAEEWSIDGVLHDGEVVFISVGHYLTEQLQSDQAFTFAQFDPTSDTRTYELATEFARRALAALGLTDGIFHLEAFCPPDGSGLIYGECAARPGGGGIPAAITRKLGVDMIAYDALIAVGRGDEYRPTAIDSRFIGGMWLPGRPGEVVIGYASRDELLAAPGVEEVAIDVAPGRQLPDFRGRFEYSWVRLGTVIIAAGSRVEFENAAADVRRRWERSLRTTPGPRNRMTRSAMRVERAPGVHRETGRPCFLSIGYDESLERASALLGVDLVAIQPSYLPTAVDGATRVPTGNVDDPAEALTALERSGLRELGYRRVISTTAASNAVPAAVLGVTLGCDAVSLPAALLLTSLATQRGAVADAGVDVVEFLELDVRVDDAAATRWDGWPAIVTPDAGSGLTRVRRCLGPAELTAKIAALGAEREADDQAPDRYVIDRETDAGSWSVEGFAGGDGIVLAAVLENSRPAPESASAPRRETRMLVDPVTRGPEHAQALATAGRVLSAIGLQRTLFSVRFARTAEGHLLFDRCHDHLSGGLVHALIETKHGVSVAEVALRDWSGADALDVGTPIAASVGEVSLPLLPGWLLSSPSETEVLAQPGAVFATGIPLPGTPIGGRRGWRLDAARAVIKADSEAGLVRRMDELAGWYTARLDIAPYRATNRELWRRAQAAGRREPGPAA
jgi:biotin carboxylase